MLNLELSFQCKYSISIFSYHFYLHKNHNIVVLFSLSSILCLLALFMCQVVVVFNKLRRVGCIKLILQRPSSKHTRAVVLLRSNFRVLDSSKHFGIHQKQPECRSPDMADSLKFWSSVAVSHLNAAVEFLRYLIAVYSAKYCRVLCQILPLTNADMQGAVHTLLE